MSAVLTSARPTPEASATASTPDIAGPAVRVALVFTGLLAGFFYAYQISVLPGLDLVDDVTYVETFQAVNATIRSAPFALIFFGTGPVLLATVFLTRTQAPRTRLLVIASLVCYLAVLGITFGGNVPLNNDLALVTDLSGDGAAAARLAFEGPWNTLNLIRTGLAVATAVLLAVVTPRRR